MPKKLIYVLLLLMATIGVHAQSAYVVPNFRSADRYTSSDDKYISVVSVIPISGDANGYTIEFRDSQNVDRAIEQYATSFKFYLSYQGKRVSDYQQANSNYKYTFTCKCYVWPGKIPNGHEKYVSVQIGEEPKPQRRPVNL
jgi:hypothetical protein